ncbi:hypothetical protein G8770_22610 [Aestuariicella hydrocarbonica]|uniref:Uncharacterized protein n=1 Tax=Pseudomaricurvus hydrocarbonicus TaxID=1470433 RepID=A0A9E5MQ81_9GAMM|nr:hypothetical protein [Aestuariicella hydrocarbonica]NHO68354.1 hypothetical protein [Aestuariicella hydrocarbonica]
MQSHTTLIARTVLLALGLGALLLLSGCSVTPHANLGLDVNYYNGGFHVRPEAHVGISGRPN